MGVPTEYFFEYGGTKSYGLTTEIKTLPPKLNAFYVEHWDNGLAGWLDGRNNPGKSQHFSEGGYSKGFIRSVEPSTLLGGYDTNHWVNADILQLVESFYTGPLVDQSVLLAGGAPDLRGAKISMSIRGNNFIPNASALIVWIQSQRNMDVYSEEGKWRRANWGYFRKPLTRYLLDGKWYRVEFELLNNAKDWRYAGNNPHEGERKERYSYQPLDASLGNVNVNLIFLLTGVDVNAMPKGSIDFDEFQLAYRNTSLIFPGNGGTLISYPHTSTDDPATLIDGWRNGAGRMWHSKGNREKPAEFIYIFKDPVEINTIQIHQNPDYPTKDVEVYVSEDGRSYDLAVQGVIPQKEQGYENFAFLIKRGLVLHAKYLKVKLVSGYRKEGVGLGEIEVFGSGTKMLPDAEMYYVNSDTSVVDSNFICHYRLVARNESGVFYGRDRVMCPILEWQNNAFSVKVFKLFLHKVKRKIISRLHIRQ